MESSKPQESGSQSVDRISDLPNPVLGEILSYLPLKEVIGTAVLSRKWKSLFATDVPVRELVLYDSDTKISALSKDPKVLFRHFMHFIHKLLGLEFKNLKRVILHCLREYGDESIVTWVCGFLKLKIEHLGLMYNLKDSLLLFTNIDGCVTLTSLELGGNFVLCIPEKFMLPHLRNLSLYELPIGDDGDELQNLLNGSPVLNYLCLYDCYLGDTGILLIEHKSVQKLELFGNAGNCTVGIYLPNLKDVWVYGKYLAEFVLMDSKKIDSLRVEYILTITNHANVGNKWQTNARRLWRLLRGCSNATHLSLLRDSMEGLCTFSHLPRFDKLTCLALGGLGTDGWGVFVKILKLAPNLTEVTFQEGLDIVGSSSNILMSCLPRCLEKKHQEN